jgi:TolB-like protein/class 3 adenylate cyclase/Flp pilus assembly protein TadD
VWGTLHGFGPFVRETENQSLLAVQWWTAVLSITAVALSASMAERRRVEEELQQQKVVLETANRTRDHFLATFSHELRTPLTPVISALEPLETERQTEEDRSVEPKSDLEPEIAHLLSIDVAGYSKLSNNEQIELVQELNQIVRSTECFRSAEASGKLNRVPTGDGMALLFFRSPEEPVRCALEISRALQDHPRIQLRMGVHSGPVNRITDVNDKTNFAGSGMNVVQRVLDCGDAGHILLSAHVAEDLAQCRHWQPCLHDLGECEVKHGQRLHLFNLCKENLGNPQVPEKLRRRRRWKQESDIVRPVSLPRRPRSLLVLALVVAALALVISSLTFFQRVSLRTRSTPPEETASKDTVLIPEKSIAILPFENLSGDKANDYFADGIQDEILTRLSKIADLKVISRTSTQHYKSAPENLPEIAKQLGVAHILEGRVQKSGDAVRVNVQLIKAANDSHLWADTFDRKLTDIFAVESEVAKAIGDQLQAKISATEKAAIEKAPTADLVAYDLYLRAQELFADTSDPVHAREKLPQTVHLLEEAVTLDPQFLAAWCLLSRVHAVTYFRGHDHTTARLDQANAAVQAALRLQPDTGEAHLALANYYYHGFRDFERARGELVIAKRTLPNNADVIRYLGFIDRREGHWEEATRNMERALELDPHNFFIVQQLAYVYQWQRRYADEARTYDRALAIVPADPYTRNLLALVALDWRADIKPFQTTLATLVAENPSVAPDVDSPLYALCERTAAAATRTLTNYPHEGVVNNGVNYPYAYWEGAVARCQGDSAKARMAFTAARKEVEKTVEKQPDFAAALSLLGMIDAGLDRKEEALREGRRGCELLPISKDAIDGADIAINLAQIYAWTGEKDRAIEQIAAVERVPNSLSYGLLKLHPYWDSLRGDPRFEKIVASLAPKKP